MAVPDKKVAFVERAMAVHIKRGNEPGTLPDGSEAWDVESRVFNRGESIPLKDLPPYLSEAVKAGKVPGLKALSTAEIKQRAEIIAEYNQMGSFEISDEGPDNSPEFPAEEF